MKMFTLIVLMSCVFAVYGMDTENSKKITEIRSEHCIDYTYETMMKKFWEEFLCIQAEKEFASKKNKKYLKETDAYFMVYAAWPLKSTIVYPLGSCDAKNYKQMKSVCKKDVCLLALDAIDLSSIKLLCMFLKKNTLSFLDQEYIMEASIDTMKKVLKEQSKELGNLCVQQVKPQSFKNFKLDHGDKKDWADVLFHDKKLEENKTQLLYLLQCNNVKAFLGTYDFEQFNCKVPFATNMMYCGEKTILFFPAFEKIKPEISVYSEKFGTKKTITTNDQYRKKMLYKALKCAHKNIEKVIITVLGKDKGFFESIGMKHLRTLNTYSL